RTGTARRLDKINAEALAGGNPADIAVGRKIGNGSRLGAGRGPERPGTVHEEGRGAADEHMLSRHRVRREHGHRTPPESNMPTVRLPYKSPRPQIGPASTA